MSVWHDKCFISFELYRALETGSLGVSREINKGKLGIYVVTFRILGENHKKRTIIYNYLYYPEIFLNCLLAYSLIRYNLKKSITFSEWGDYLIIIDKDLLSIADNQTILSYNNINESYTRRVDYLISEFSTSPFHNLYDILDILKMMNYIADNESMAHLLHLIHNKSISPFIKVVMKGCENVDLICNELSNEFVDNYIKLMNSSVFMVRDLNLLKENLSKLNYDVNEGAQKWRGQVNSMNNFLSFWDCDFRNSLYDHHCYHIDNGRLDYGLLPRNKFSFKNIHKNLGQVRWYSISSC